jgi:ATP-binding cassette subfamily C (CFTR/MRP) protein 5
MLLFRKKNNASADNAGLFSYVYITWMTQYLWKAYKKGLTLTDLPNISVYDTCEYNALR